jgi:hypothetical protein
MRISRTRCDAADWATRSSSSPTVFPEFVRVLGAISALELFRTEQDTLRLYKRWLQTGSQHEADLLVRRGLIPVMAPPRRQ